MAGARQHTSSPAIWYRALLQAHRHHQSVPGGDIYTDQNVVGLSDADPDQPLAFAFVPCTALVARGSSSGDGAKGPPTPDAVDPESAVPIVFATDPLVTFLAQSAFKPLSFAMALERLDKERQAELSARVRDEPNIGYASMPDEGWLRV
eukprot:CAMPEP_0113583004 /NCGR_PEP_ID=MMETSP0015_2-20120614/32252_1 /TAXON_ID=2838 /ORGANISM="Odontella" /LENGTH=148 /DNA_ID=CAMNT_0000487785 /DNA_START=808 /DNA_END=1250 /DNA_ORIENTATION=+ /assembly_acc=CAM_ASM_000160